MVIVPEQLLQRPELDGWPLMELDRDIQYAELLLRVRPRPDHVAWIEFIDAAHGARSDER